jgi:hypothetical protein
MRARQPALADLEPAPYAVFAGSVRQRVSTAMQTVQALRKQDAARQKLTPGVLDVQGQAVQRRPSGCGPLRLGGLQQREVCSRVLPF